MQATFIEFARGTKQGAMAKRIKLMQEFSVTVHFGAIPSVMLACLSGRRSAKAGPDPGADTTHLQ